jgi:hypothetical protein
MYLFGLSRSTDINHYEMMMYDGDEEDVLLPMFVGVGRLLSDIFEFQIFYEINFGHITSEYRS